MQLIKFCIFFHKLKSSSLCLVSVKLYKRCSLSTYFIFYFKDYIRENRFSLYIITIRLEYREMCTIDTETSEN